MRANAQKSGGEILPDASHYFCARSVGDNHRWSHPVVAIPDHARPHLLRVGRELAARVIEDEQWNLREHLPEISQSVFSCSFGQDPG
jgi:hypothetical protein